MDINFLKATVLAQDVSILISLIAFFIIPKEGRRKFLLLGLALLFSFLTDGASAISYFVFRRSANTYISIGAIISTSLYLLFYWSQFKSKEKRFLVLVVVAIDILFAVVNMFFIQGVSSLTSYSFIIRSLEFTLLSLLYFYALIKELPTESITKLPMFWINTAFLLYYAGTFFQWLLMDYLINVLKGDVITTYSIKNGLGVIHYLLIAVGLWYHRSLFLPKATTA